jgi:hypothetical protein
MHPFKQRLVFQTNPFFLMISLLPPSENETFPTCIKAELMKRCKANSEAQQGLYAGGAHGAASSTDLTQKNYVY